MPLQYKTALVTGATSGIGYALAERLIASNVHVIAVGRLKERLDQLLATHGSSKVSVEAYDVSNLDGLGEWAKKITLKYPTLDCIFLNAGVQNAFNFTPPTLETANLELTVNYLSPLYAITYFLPHLESLSSPGSIILVSSGLGLVPLPRCANYCASKAAIHSIAWSLRAQLADRGDRAEHIKVIEIIPPAVKTKLHICQADLVAAGQSDIGMPLDQFMAETWAELDKGEEEIIIGQAKAYASSEAEKKKAFEVLLAMVKGQNK